MSYALEREEIGRKVVESVVQREKFEKENEQLKQQIEKMKCCANCKHAIQGEKDCCGECFYCDGDMCECAITGDLNHWKNKGCDNWELAE